MTMNVAFGSDNHAGVHPHILKAMNDCNKGYAIAYGDDEYTEHLEQMFHQQFGPDCIPFLVYNGTAANILGLKAVTDSFHAIYCPETAHLNVHECGGPEHFLGCKLITLPTPDGKLTVDLVREAMFGVGDPHVAQPRVISITQPTELGTLYSIKELKDLSTFAHNNDMILHMDGARLGNAAAALHTGFKELTSEVGVDVLSFGGTKNGMMCGESVIFFNKTYAQHFHYIRKQGMQLASKMRYLAVQFEAYFADELWRKNASHANAMAQLLASELQQIPKLTITQKIEGNAVFVVIPPPILKQIQKHYFFHVFNEALSEARLMCSFSMTKADIMQFVDTIKKISEKEQLC